MPRTSTCCRAVQMSVGVFVRMELHYTRLTQVDDWAIALGLGARKPIACRKRRVFFWTDHLPRRVLQQSPLC